MAIPEELSGETPIKAPEYRKGDRVISKVVKGYFPRVIEEDTERRVRFVLQDREASYKSQSEPDRVYWRRWSSSLSGYLSRELCVVKVPFCGCG